MTESSKESFLSKILRAASPFLILGAAIGIFALLIFSRPEVKIAPPQEHVWSVAAIEVKKQNIEPTLKVFGEVVAGRHVELRALVAGEILETHPDLRNGGIVEKGEQILRIDPFTYKTAVDETIARLSEARARLDEQIAQKKLEAELLKRAQEQAELSARDLKRAERLARDGHISQKTLDDKKLAYSRQLQTVERHQNNLSIQEARLTQQEGAVARVEIALARVERDLERTLLKAPFRGFLSNVNAAQGKHVNANDRIAQLTDADQLEVRFHLSDQQFGRILTSNDELKGQRIKISWNIGDETLLFDGEIIRIAAEMSQVAGGVSVFSNIDIPNVDSALRPGAFVQVHLPDRVYQNVARLPADALYDDNIVYAIVNDRLEPRAVDVIGFIDDDVIIQNGLKNGEKIMTTWFAEAGPGTKVSIPNLTTTQP